MNLTVSAVEVVFLPEIKVKITFFSIKWRARLRMSFFFCNFAGKIDLTY